MTSLTVAHLCVLVASLLPILCAGIAKWGTFGRSRRDGGYDNDNPRSWLAAQTAWRARANAAQANSFEALPLFIGAVLIAHQVGVSQATLDGLAVVFVLLRLAYIACYVGGWSTLRSLVWVAGLGVCIAILLSGWR
ncbi:MAG: glutathione metabolism protein [Rhodoferax sp.]|nr:glutathione metabolism protein [Rhodoferax sp.]